MGHDLTLIRNGYDVEGTGKRDLGQLATKHLGVGVGSRSLEDLCAALLGQRISKGDVRMSNWEQTLSDDQVCKGCGPMTCVSGFAPYFCCCSVACRRSHCQTLLTYARRISTSIMHRCLISYLSIVVPDL